MRLDGHGQIARGQRNNKLHANGLPTYLIFRASLCQLSVRVVRTLALHRACSPFVVVSLAPCVSINPLHQDDWHHWMLQSAECLESRLVLHKT